MSRSSYTTFKHCLAQKQANNTQLAPNSWGQESRRWTQVELAAHSHKALAPLEFRFCGSRTSCPHAGRTQAVLVCGAAYRICGKAEGTRRHRFYKNYRWLSNLTGGYHPSMTATPSQPRVPHVLNIKCNAPSFSIIRKSG